MNLVIVLRGRQEKLPDFQKSESNQSNVVLESFVPVVAVTKQKAVPSIEFLPDKGNFEREKEVEDTMLDLSKPFTEGLEEYYVSSSTPKARSDPKHDDEEKSLGDKLPSVVTDAGRDTLPKDSKSKKEIIGSPPRGNHNVFTHYLEDPNCDILSIRDHKSWTGFVRGLGARWPSL